MPSDLPRPPYDPEIVTILAQRPWPINLNLEMLKAVRANPSLIPVRPSIDEIIAGRAISHVERRVSGLNPHDPEVTLSIFTPKSDSERPRPCIYYIHGGGMILFTRLDGIATPLSWITDTNAILVSVEYRLAPENPDPAPISDCYAGLKWVSEHVQDLGIDRTRIMIAGGSAGGGLAAGTALMCRDLKGPKLCAQFLGCPMLDDRNDTLSSRQYVDEGSWSRGSNIMAWNALLEGKAGQSGVSIYAGPGRAEDLSGLPNTFIDVGSAEIFRDENVAYASKLWTAGVQAELHVYAGGCHGFDTIAPNSRIAITALSVQAQWVKHVLRPRDEKVEIPANMLSCHEALAL